jgi:hypothetical protein
MTQPYEPNPLFEEEVQTQVEFRKGMYEINKGVAAAVIAVAPEHTGFYKGHIRAVEDGVVARDSFWHWIEFGSVHNHPRAPLRRGVRAAGLRFVPLPKP